MKTNLILASITFMFFACSDSPKNNSKNNDLKKNYTEKELSLQGISFNIKFNPNDTINNLVITPKNLEIDNSPLFHTIDINSEISNIEINDLDSDGSPELLIYIKTIADPYDYSSLIAYSVNNRKSVSSISFPDIFEDEELITIFSGDDEFSVVETYLSYRFPINDTEKIKQFNFKLEKGETSKKFVLDKVTEVLVD